MVEQKLTFVEVAERLGIGYENTRAIYKTYLKNNRRVKNPKGRRQTIRIQTSKLNNDEEVLSKRPL